MKRTIITFSQTQALLYVVWIFVVGLSVLWFFPPRGLVGSYYDNPEWRGTPAFVQRDQKIALDAVTQRQQDFPHTHFSVTWEGWIRIDHTGNYTFATISDDGSSLVIDEVMVVNNGGYHGAEKVAKTLFLTQGMHSIRISYFQGVGDYALRVSWTAPGASETLIPAQHLYSQPFPFRGLGLLTRHLKVLSLLFWGGLGVIVISRLIIRTRSKTWPMLKKYAQNIALSLITIIVVLITAEAGIRVTMYLSEQRKDLQLQLKESQKADFPDNPTTYSLKGLVQASPYDGIVYELKPNLRGQFQGVPLITNSRGLRDFEYSYQKPANTFRIVGLGDSLLFGWGVKMEDTSLKVLERKLNQHASPLKYEVINFAVPGYNTAIETEVFIKKCLPYSPDIAVIYFFVNDYDMPYFMKLPQSYSTLRKSYLFDFLYSRYGILRGSQEKKLIDVLGNKTTDLETSDHLDDDPTIPNEYRYMVGEKGVVKALNKLARITAEYDIPLIVSMLYTYPGLDPEYTYPSIQFREKQLQVITRLSQENGFLLLDLYPYYTTYMKQHPNKKYPDVFWVIPWEDVHPSILAHTIEAEAFYSFLIKHQLINVTK